MTLADSATLAHAVYAFLAVFAWPARPTKATEGASLTPPSDTCHRTHRKMHNYDQNQIRKVNYTVRFATSVVAIKLFATRLPSKIRLPYRDGE